MSTRVFEISVKAETSDVLRPEFDDVEITADRSVTRLRVVACDSAALHGVLARIEALGLELLDVHAVDDDDDTARFGSEPVE